MIARPAKRKFPFLLMRPALAAAVFVFGLVGIWEIADFSVEKLPHRVRGLQGSYRLVRMSPESL